MNAVAQPHAQTQQITIPVTGMTCAACQSRVQRTLSKTTGVVDASVNLMMGNATVSYDASAIHPGALVARIRETGYGAELPVDGRSAFEEQIEHDAAEHEEFFAIRRKAIASGVIGVVTMVASMTLMHERAIDWVLLLTTLSVMSWAG